jgi:hypothetical protein
MDLIKIVDKYVADADNFVVHNGVVYLIGDRYVIQYYYCTLADGVYNRNLRKVGDVNKDDLIEILPTAQDSRMIPTGSLKSICSKTSSRGPDVYLGVAEDNSLLLFSKELEPSLPHLTPFCPDDIRRFLKVIPSKRLADAHCLIYWIGGYPALAIDFDDLRICIPWSKSSFIKGVISDDTSKCKSQGPQGFCRDEGTSA